eukprot:7379087-Prymnesium_polylepis.1
MNERHLCMPRVRPCQSSHSSRCPRALVTPHAASSVSLLRLHRCAGSSSTRTPRRTTRTGRSGS